jgi:hypothetical protein
MREKQQKKDESIYENKEKFKNVFQGPIYLKVENQKSRALSMKSEPCR